MVGTTISISDLLRERTSVDHIAAERHPLQAALVRGVLPREVFVAYIGQLFVVHRVLEAALDRLIRGQPLGPIAQVVAPEQFQTRSLREDLEAFGQPAESVDPLPETQAVIDQLLAMEHEQPLALLGAWYVLEGSRNGGVFIARSVRRAYQLTPGRGDRYWDGYGEAQRERWAAWKSAIDRAPITPEQTPVLVEGARGMFRSIAHIGSGVMSAAPSLATGDAANHHKIAGQPA